ncbi:MAG: methyl-accepting chemotaxis protein [Lachnospiraceae bacterium]|nr:methyl-accepting chemotaxis protein [Lachnospiraceae bacterium]
MMNNVKKTQSIKIFQTIKSKILLMGIFSIFVAVVIGVIGINSINRSSTNSEIESIANEIDVLQAKNLALEAQYQYYIEQKYLDGILGNLEQMIANVKSLQTMTNDKYTGDVSQMLNSLTRIETNYGEISNLGGTRSFSKDAGLYQQYIEASRALGESFLTLVDKEDWLEIKWIDARMWTSGEHVTVDGKEYVKVVYKGPVPENVKRNTLAFRVGGTLTYDKNCYITDVRLTDGANFAEIDISALDKVNGTGLAYVDSEITTFDLVPAIRVGCNFNAANEGWEEFAAQISVKEYAPQNYSNIEYTMYFEPNGMEYEYKYGGSYSGVYGYAGSVEQLDKYMDEYSKLVVEGKSVTEVYGQIETLMAEVAENIPLYTTSEELAQNALAKLSAEKDIIQQMREVDDRILALKSENVQLNSELTSLCETIKKTASEDMVAIKVNVMRVSVIVIVLATIVLVGMTVLIGTSIDRNVVLFRKTLDKITQGRIAVRVRADGKDEFAQFGRSLNAFLDKLVGSIGKLQEISTELAQSGGILEDKANKTKTAAEVISTALEEIAHGASAQAEDISSSSLQVSNMQENMLLIMDGVNMLSTTSRDMSENGREATRIVQELSSTSDMTTEAFQRISEQIYKTNASVVKIQEVVNLIAEIASQTNLLSLNASIEAARAGEAGRGFAVVASEIQKLAEQTNSSAKIIDEIILSLSEESRQTVQSINEVTDIIGSQKEKLDETKMKFNTVETGIRSTSGGMMDVLQQADVCGKAGKKVVDLMTNLSAIAEENAASTQQTNASMNELNDATASLARTAMELKKLSIVVNDNLNYFSMEPENN